MDFAAWKMKNMTKCQLFLAKSFVIGWTFFLRDIFEHHVELFLRIVGKVKQKKSVEGVVEVRVDVETQELRVDLEIFLKQRRHAVVTVAELHKVAVELVDGFHILFHQNLNVTLVEVRHKWGFRMEQLRYFLVGMLRCDVVNHETLVELRVP